MKYINDKYKKSHMTSWKLTAYDKSENIFYMYSQNTVCYYMIVEKTYVRIKGNQQYSPVFCAVQYYYLLI